MGTVPRLLNDLICTDRPAATMDEKQHRSLGGAHGPYEVDPLLGIGAIGELSGARRGSDSAGAHPLADRFVARVAKLRRAAAAQALAKAALRAPAKLLDLLPAFLRQPLAALGQGSASKHCRTDQTDSKPTHQESFLS